ncbi:MAG: class I SAM-dependent methyltransferase [Candidatus Aminicenantes bacterium]|nr:class I SAM-dependent methyltransferase [Candidatus Aminicenantes bacterium]
MKRNRIAAYLAILLAALSASLPAGQDKAPALGVGAHEITIRNVTDKPFAYTLRPYGSEDKPQAYTLKPESLHRFPAPGIVVVGYLKYGREITYSLYPGRAYSFRIGTGGQVDIWVGAHGKEDAVDLAPFVPTAPEVIIKMLDLAKVGQSSVVYDIGCGDGRIVVTAAKVYGAHGVGIDIEPARIRESKANAEGAMVDNLVKFKTSDVMKVDLSPATVVTMYLLPESNALLRPKLEKELKPGTFIVTHNYMIPGWEKKEVESAVVPLKDGTEHSVFLYKR